MKLIIQLTLQCSPGLQVISDPHQILIGWATLHLAPHTTIKSHA